MRMRHAQPERWSNDHNSTRPFHVCSVCHWWSELQLLEPCSFEAARGIFVKCDIKVKFKAKTSGPWPRRRRRGAVKYIYTAMAPVSREKKCSCERMFSHVHAIVCHSQPPTLSALDTTADRQERRGNRARPTPTHTLLAFASGCSRVSSRHVLEVL